MFSFQIVIILTALTSIFQLALSLPGKRQDVSIMTTFSYDDSCTPAQQAIIKQANLDALALANAALDNRRELLGTTNTGGKFINFQTRAAIDYWGPPSQNGPYRQRIFDTLYRATQAYCGTGWDDWWNNRYVFVFCRDLHNDCGTSPAYTLTKNVLYPNIVYCPTFFANLSSHGDMLNKIQQDTTGQMKRNIRNLRSQATTALHEWLHIAGFSSEVCQGGCVDTWQTIGGVKTRTYKAGRTKLLAQKDPSRAANTNDNYAYFAMSRFMEKNLKTYPEYPHAWDNSQTPAANEAIEDQEPGAPSTLQFWELEDSGVGDDIATASPATASVYPDWYQPVIGAAASPTLPSLTVPTETQSALAEPNIDDVICQTTSGSPAIADCVHAFGSLNDSGDEGALHGKKGGTWWAGYVQSCALAIYYTEDWTESCNATLADVNGHANAIFEGCENGSLGTVGGYVPFAVPNCPATIEIIHTSGEPPQGTLR